MNNIDISIIIKFSGRVIFLLSLIILFLSCRSLNENKNIAIESVEKYVIDSFEVYFNDTIPSNIGLIAADKDKAVFLHYYFSKIFNYDISKQMFQSFYFLPRDWAETPNILEFYFPDSAIYYTMYSKKIALCKGNKIIIDKKVFERISAILYLLQRSMCKRWRILLLSALFKGFG